MTIYRNANKESRQKVPTNLLFAHIPYVINKTLSKILVRIIYENIATESSSLINGQLTVYTTTDAMCCRLSSNNPRHNSHIPQPDTTRKCNQSVEIV